MNVRIALISALLLVAPGGDASAQEIQVGFTGEMVSNSCAITVGRGGSDGVVQLGAVSNADLKRSGQRSIKRSFFITVGSVAKPCLNERVQVQFSGPHINPEGRLANAGTAQNVEVVVMSNVPGSSYPDINLDTNKESPVVDIPPSTGWARISFAAAMHAVGAVRGGTVSTTANYTVIYP